MAPFKKRERLWYAVFLFVFFLIALEVTGRIYLKYFLQKSSTPKFRFNSYRIYEHVPDFKEGDKKGNWIEINKQGFRRSNEVVIQKPVNTLRIFLMGASSAHSISSAAPFPIRHIYNNETIDAFLERLLKQSFKEKNIEVINAAVTGYQFFQQTNYLINEIVLYNPDMVIFFDGANDCYISNPAYHYFDGNKFQFWKKRLQQPSVSGIFDYVMLWSSKFSAFARGYLSWKGIKEAENMTSENPVYSNSNNVQVTVNNQQQIALKTWIPVLQTNFNILKQHQIKTVFALQPMLALRNQKLLSQTESSFRFTDQNCVNVYGIVTKQLDSICALNQVAYLDYNAFFNDTVLKGQQLFIDYCHLTPDANKVVADRLFLEVTRQLAE
jgi:hypothetical protein